MDVGPEGHPPPPTNHEILLCVCVWGGGGGGGVVWGGWGWWCGVGGGLKRWRIVSTVKWTVELTTVTDWCWYFGASR